ncbi:PREDICTED: LOW QUALITY PROTEIN: putative olfactory receptor GPCRLTM7 [Cercocebus atys]|uniref:LOW QUALITY PROTEIN: putative olfactory receptor GPCRLTM7 n=1 Tax=Cercocebus atys TaxID=9531 RepID=UPI0005F5072F|nr:PREDICTED: LOW QUALITY PROTEIN: putative olfactory receptor GPCRLTM7 [Cercocebus atys]
MVVSSMGLEENLVVVVPVEEPIVFNLSYARQNPVSEANYSEVSESVFLGLSTYRPVQHFLLAISTVFYVTVVLGNIIVVFIVTFDPHLHSFPHVLPFSQLSFMDLCFSTLTVTKMISDLYSGHNTISFQGCVIQIFVLHVLGGSEMALLIAMAFDRYVAKCKPLHHLTIMSPQMCILLLSRAWVIGLIRLVTQLAFVVHLPFCSPNEIDSFYCDLPWFIKLSCIDSYRVEFLVTANSGFISTGTFFLLIISYIFNLVTVWKHSSRDLSEALSTLSAHITVVALFFGPCIFIYVWPFPTVPVDTFLAILDFMTTLILSPAIYSLQNKDMEIAMKRLSSQLLSLRKI